jgi:hypothetical protein
MRISPVLGAALGFFTLIGPARGQENLPTAGLRAHDGFYLRLGAGPGFVFGSNTLDKGDVQVDVSGFALSTELAFGGTPAPGLVIGGGSFSMVVPAPEYATDGAPEVTAGTHHISGIGPFVDYYFDPSGGAHAQAALLLSGAYVQEKDETASASGFGYGAMLGGGYEFWIGEQWSLGPLVRLTVYSDKLEQSGSGTNVKSTLTLFVPSVLIAATYH